MSTIIKYTWIVFILLISINTISAAGRPSLVKPVVVDVAQLRELAPTAEYSGTVISKDDARISSEVEGRLTWVADVGALIKKGDVVAKLDDIFLQQQRSEELAIIQSEQAKLSLYEKEVARFQRLIKKNNIAQNELDKSISDRAVANSNIIAARARLAQIEERISRSNLRAPFAGVISERFSQSGEWTQNGNPLVRLIDFNNSEIQVRVPQTIYSLISLNSMLSVNNAGQTIMASVQTIVPVGTTSSRLFELRLKPQQAIPPGTLVRISIPTAKAREVISIHRDALVLRKGSISVFRINNENTSEQLQVNVGIGDGDYIEIIGDINTGDRIVTRGGERLRPGETVSISNESN
ncbi:MAG: efflux RND transporter periplasmic adaptor subunit [Gammaproteobacteria bacterium]